ncbi:unnamed protein product [Peronospora effusa]|uniref:Uncharacterized protein n=1 Tax=Peronospora effusa TaxID=542832 RepID=A0A3M6VA08_9STRA|nr:hypothetical protein DD238_006740 [Peronospora effusa]RQM12979.1 hypothetical protein DD237_006721 [Peronospora effusa]CAI5703320.1 unnamed protein product [Peronospora effusa]
MIKRFAVLFLVVLAAMLSCAYADDAPAVEKEPAKPTEAVPPGVTITGEKKPVPMNTEQFEQIIGGGGGFIPTGGITYRWRYTYPFAGGFRYGWRYPIGYWNTFGHTIFGPTCKFGQSGTVLAAQF